LGSGLAIKKSLGDYEREGKHRNDVMVRDFLDGEFRMNEISVHSGVYYSTVSRATKKMEMFDCKSLYLTLFYWKGTFYG